jgi:hypothetical protein
MERHVYPQTVVSVSWHFKNPTEQVGLVQSRHHHIEMLPIFHHDIAE